jgi:hypothetical protein
LTNLFRCNHCNHCGLAVIAEELGNHNCKSVVDYKIEGDILWSSDGGNWYPIKLTPKNKHPFKTPDDSTEPVFAFNHVSNSSEFGPSSPLMKKLVFPTK